MSNKVEIIKKLLAFAVLLVVLLLFAACGIYYFERDVQPEAFGSIFDATRYTVLTLTTIGYVDVQPTTSGGKVLTVVVNFIGFFISVICLLAIVSGSLVVIKKFASFLIRAWIREPRR